MKRQFATIDAANAFAAAVQAEPMQDVDCIRIPAQPVAIADMIEVIELFHCR
jgi:hypothetical protein